MIRGLQIAVAVSALSLLLVIPASANHYPGRDLYKDISIITLDDLAQHTEQYLIVDVRTPLEFEVMHIKGAVNLEYPSTKFGKQIKALHNKANKPMVFYAGGNLCFDPYGATQAAHELFGVDRTYTFDGGMSEWVKGDLDKTVFQGEKLAKDRLISEADYQAHMLDPMVFESKVAGDFTVIDVRTYHEREGVGIFFGREQWLPMDRYTKLLNVLKQVQATNKPLLVFDDHGHRTRMLQYVLRDLGITDYKFMSGGAKAYFKMVADMHQRDYDHGQMGKHVDAHAHGDMAPSEGHVMPSGEAVDKADSVIKDHSAANPSGHDMAGHKHDM